MSVNMAKLRSQMDASKQRRASNINRIPEDKTVNLRVLEYTDADGDSAFAAQVTEWRVRTEQGQQPKAVLDRQTTFGAPCAASRLHEMAQAHGVESPFERRRHQYFMNAINIDEPNPQVQIWAVPTTVWEIIAGMLTSEEWENVLEPQIGHSFKMSRTGRGLATEYSCTVSREPWPVSAELLSKVKDPLTVVVDPGLDGQAKELSVELTDLFDDPDGLEMKNPVQMIDKQTKPNETSAPAVKKKKKVTKKKAVVARKSSFPHEIGDQVIGTIDGDEYSGTITETNTDTATVVFDDGDTDTLAWENIKADGLASGGENLPFLPGEKSGGITKPDDKTSGETSIPSGLAGLLKK